MKATYWQRGETLDYTPEKAVENGEVVSLGTRIGVAGGDIKAGELGHLHVVGVFEMPKAASTAITMGATVYYDVANDKITTTASTGSGDTKVDNIPAGYAAAAAGANDATVLVKLLG